MKKLKLKFIGTNELTKEEMKKIAGGTGGNNWIQCCIVYPEDGACGDCFQSESIPEAYYCGQYKSAFYCGI